MENLFINALKNKYTYKSSKGLLSTEDLWHLNAEGLDDVYINLVKQKEKNVSVSLSKKSDKNAKLENQIKIVEYIYNEKEAAALKKVEQKAINDKINMLKELQNQAELDKFKNMTPEQIQAEIDKLEAEK